MDAELLARCLGAVVSRNDAFRLRFRQVEGMPRQWAAPMGAPLPAPVVDCSVQAHPAEAVQDWLTRSFEQRVEPAAQRPYELAVLRQSDSVCHAYIKTHHVLCDAWGLQLVLAQLRAEYQAAVDGDQAVPQAPASFLEQVAAEEAYRGSAAHQDDRAFFTTLLTGVEPALFPRRATAGERSFGRHSFPVPREAIDRIKARGHTPFVYFASALALYLARVRNADTVVLGAPLLNRPGAQAKQTVGQFANTLPLKVSVDWDASIDQLLDQVRESTRALLRHQRLALSEVLRALPHSAGPRLLFDTTVSYLRWPRSADLPGLRLRTRAQTHAHDTDALAIWIYEFDDSSDVVVDLEYGKDVFDADFPLEAAVGHLQNLLDGLVAGEATRLADLPMLSEAERHELVEKRNATDRDFPADATLAGLFADQVARQPGRTALVDADGTRLSFAELDARADRIARALRAHGIRRDDRVAVVAQRDAALVAALVGIHRAGAGYLPILPDFPAERIALLIADADCAAVLAGTGATGIDDIAGGRWVGELHRLAAEPEPDNAAEAGVQPPEQQARPQDLAYVIYTSGSTGRPKGVMVEHRSVVNRLWWMQRAYPIGEHDVLLQKTPISFDVSVWELFWWSFTGARLVLPAVGAEKDPRLLLEAISAHGVTVTHFVPSMLGPFLDELDRSPEARQQSASLRLVFCSGEALPPSRVAQFNRLFEDRARLVNLYGPTEATVDVSYYDCPPGAPQRVPIGRPIDNTALYVLGAGDQPQPLGAPGELCIGGVGVARGYLGRPELTAERFVADPFRRDGHMYRTGDIARWLADGTLEYLGRADGQVKIRGNRVELGEVGEALKQLPGIRDAVVVDRFTETRGRHLVGYHVGDADAASLRAGLGSLLPDFMVPALFVEIPRIPLTDNGKLNRAELPEPPSTAPSGRSASSPTERVLAEVWQEVLGVQAVGIDDDYFALGGDSILLLRVKALAERRGIRFSQSDLLASPTIAGLAERLAASGDSAGLEAVELEPFELIADVDRPRMSGYADAFGVSQLSFGMLYHADQHPNSSVYHDVFRYRMQLSSWDAEAFGRAVQALVDRHPALRSSFDLAGFSEPVQIVHAQLTGGWRVMDLRDAEPAEAERQMRDYIEQRRRHSYDFGRPMMFEFAALVRPEHLDLVLSFHHAILDGWSVANLLVELLDSYCAELAGSTPAGAPSAAPSPAGYVAAERQAIRSAETRGYWQQLLAGAELTSLDGFRPFSERTDAPLEHLSHRVDLPVELVAALRALAADRALPIRSILLAAHCITLQLFAGTDSVVTGVVTHGRPESADADTMTGLFLNTMPIRWDADRGSWFDAARAVFGQERRSHPHRRYPLGAIQADHGGVLQTAFNYVDLHVMQSLNRLPGVRLLDLEVHEESNFTLFGNVIVDPVTGRSYLRVDSEGTVVTRPQLRLWADTYLRVLGELTANPDAERDLAALAPGWREPSQPTPLLGVLNRIDRQFAQRPDRPAVSMDGRSWTYRELDERSRSVAGYLLAAGIKPGATVGIAVGRSPELIATVLGVLRAGLTCVPLDVSYPPSRLALIVDNAAPARVIADPENAHLIADAGTVVSTAEVLAGVPAAELPVVGLDELALILFTSGSTGRPKGVQLPHRMWANYVQWQLSAPSGLPGERTLQFAPLSFDMSFQEIFSTLAGGGELQMISDADRMDPATLLRVIDERVVARVLLPYVALQRLAEAAVALNRFPRGLRVIVSSGEQLRVTEEIRRLCRGLPGVRLENQYGPTETHQVSYFSMTGDPARFPDLPPIGRPLDGVELCLLDDRLRPVPFGAIGEIYAGGDCLARGYHGSPELTEERFVAHPARPGERLYRTGDLGRALPSGEIVWLGRADNQVKVRGFRIELAEVELAIMRQVEHFPGLQAAAVVARRRDGVDAFLAAFLVGDQASVDAGELSARLRAELPSYMVPAHIGWVERIPLTPSGKRDDALLRAMPLTQADRDDLVPPRDEYERVLADVLADLLGVSAVGVHDDFFSSGGTSLTGMRLVVTIEKRYGVNIPLSALIRTPTVAGLAELLRTESAVLEFDPLVPLRATGSRPPLFLVHPLGGHVLCYLKLARELPADLPVYALQAAGSDRGSTPSDSIAQMASNYLAAIRRIQPEGPYHLSGWSFGGFVAFEMARQLREEHGSEAVGQLIVLDSITIRRDHKVAVSDDALLEFFFWELVWFERSEERIEALPTELATVEEKFDFILERAMSSQVLPWGTSRATVRRLFELFQANWRALIDYQPPVIDADLTLLRADGPLPAALKPMHDAAGTAYGTPDNGWQDWTTGRLEVLDISGDHLVLMDEPHVAVMAKHLDTLLTGDAAGAAHSDGTQ